jgi:cytochrome P450 family 135
VTLPPGPRLHPVAQVLRWAARPEPFMHACRRRYGDVFTVRFAQVGTIVFATHPDAVKQVFTAGDDVLRAGEANASLEPVLGPHSVLLLDGSEHLRARRLMLPPFHGERMARYEELMAQITDAALDGWPVGEPFELQPRMQAITLDIIVRVVFGVREADRLERVRAALLELLDVSTSRSVMLPWLRRDLGPMSPWRGFLRMRDRVDAVLYDEIAQRRRADDLAERDDILSLLLQARTEDGEALSDAELRDELVTLLVAGHETTATTLAWAFERLMREPEAMERLEADARGESDDGYADAVVHETLRLRAPIPIVARMVKQPFALAGHDLPPGVMVAPCIYLLHRREDVYPDPERFWPDRFVGESPGTYTWIPFGGGRRRCLGASFALFEMKVVLRAIVSRARLRAPEPEGEPMRRRAIVFAPGRGARAVLAERDAGTRDAGRVASAA